MYVRPQGYRYSHAVRLPENYSGSAFREERENESTTEETGVTDNSFDTGVENSEENEKDGKTVALLPRTEEVPHRPSLFSKSGIGSEELLILALIFLLSDGKGSGEGGDELILLLALLLFIR